MTLDQFLHSWSPAAVLGSFVVGWRLPTPLACWRAWQVYRSLKGAIPVNALQLIPAALTLGEDAIRLAQDLETGNKDAAVAAVADALPALAQVTGKPVETLQGLLTPARVGAAFELLEATQKIVAAVEASR